MKTIAASFFALFICSACYSQKSAFNFQVGYGVSLANSTLGASTASSGNGVTYAAVKGSYGSGLRVEAGYVYNLSSLLSVQFDASYLWGKEFRSIFYYNASDYGNNSAYSRFIQLSPQIRIAFGGTKLRPYGSVGPVIGFGTLHFKSYTFIGIDEEWREYVAKGSLAIGAKTTLGIAMGQGKISYFAQVSMINMSYAPTKEELVTDNYNGTDVLPSLSVFQKQRVFKDSFDTASQDPNQPSIGIKQFYPLNSLSLNIGVSYKF